MFRLSPSHRLLFCRTAFVLLGLLPTAGVLAWGVRSRLEAAFFADPTVWSEHLSDRTGLQVQVGKARRESSGTTVLENLSVTDPETGEPIVQVRRLEVLEGEGTIDLLSSHAEVARGGCRRLWECLRERVLRTGVARRTVIRFVAQNATLHERNETLTVSELRAVMEPAATGTQLYSEFRLAGTDDRAPIQLRLHRNLQLVPPATSFELHTGAVWLPCVLAAGFLPEIERLGPGCAFQGSVQTVLTHAGCEADVRGRFDRLDLDALVTAQFPHKLSGQAQVELQHAQFAGSRLRTGSGRLESEDGVISRSLLLAVGAYLPLTVEPRVEHLEQSLWPYRKLAFEFEIQDQALRLSGKCDSTGSLLQDSQGTLVSTRRTQPAPILSLVRTMVPQSDLQAPATRETESLLRFLPLPALVPPREALQAREYVPLRLRSPQDGERYQR